MKPKKLYTANFLFLLLLALHLTFIVCEWNNNGIAYSKPLLLPVLLWVYITGSHEYNFRADKIIIAALFFSFLGDVLLLFQEKNSSFFLFGLGAFLLAHIFYIIYFGSRIKQHGKTTIQVPVSIGSFLYAALLVIILFPKLGELKIPVIVYAITILAMLLSTIHTFPGNATRASVYCILGAGLFVVSDSILAINKFHTPFGAASFFIMLTYGLAQFFLVNGILSLQKKDSP